MSMMSKPIATQGTSKDVSDEWYVTVMRLPRELVRKPTKAPKPSSKLALVAWPPRSGIGLPICARQSEGCCATRIHLVVQLCPQETAHLSKHFRPIVEVNEELQDLPMHACVLACVHVYARLCACACPPMRVCMLCSDSCCAHARTLLGLCSGSARTLLGLCA